VPLTASNVAASVRGICATYRLGPQDATLLVMPLYHGHGLIAGLLASLASGGAVYVPGAGRFSASTFWTEMAGVGATWYTAVPTIHQILLQRAAAEYPRDNPPRLRFIRSCSAPLAPSVLQQLESAFSAPVLPAYGMTESAHQAASNPLPAVGPVKAGSAGLATGVDLRIAGPDGEALGSGTPGEVCIRGAAVASGYLDAPDATARTFADGWLHTGDLGYLDPDGYLFLTGRIKELINRGGEKFSPQQIDAILLSNAKVQDALSFGVPDETYGEEISAAVILKHGQEANERELMAYCRGTLSEAGTPKRIFFVSEFPRTSKNAGDRRKLAAEFGSP
jgi:acyl-CoA synthetase (AMP-forming)/AMP-acid ligase II